MQTGHFLQTLSEHEGPISGISFTPKTHPALASSSWDKKVRTWDVFDGKRSKELYNYRTMYINIVIFILTENKII
jgi:periodic tryptophan protein 2